MLTVHASSSMGNCYSWDGLLFEAGLPFRDIMRRVAPKVCIITHEHKDHCKAAKELARFGVPIMASLGTLEAMGMNGVVMYPGKWQVIGNGFKVLPFEAVHDAREPLGFVIAKGGERVLFATDTAELNYRFDGLTEIFVECNYCDRLLAEDDGLAIEARVRIARSHMSLERLLAFFCINDMRGVKRITLLHLSDGHSDAGYFKKTIEAATGRPVSIATKNTGRTI